MKQGYSDTDQIHLFFKDMSLAMKPSIAVVDLSSFLKEEKGKNSSSNKLLHDEIVENQLKWGHR